MNNYRFEITSTNNGKVYSDPFFTNEGLMWITFYLEDKSLYQQEPFKSLVEKYYQNVDLGYWKDENIVRIRMTVNDYNRIKDLSTPNLRRDKLLGEEQLVDTNNLGQEDKINLELMKEVHGLITNLSLGKIDNIEKKLTDLLQSTDNKAIISDKLFDYRVEAYFIYFNEFVKENEELSDELELLEKVKPLLMLNHLPPVLKIYDLIKSKWDAGQGKLTKVFNTLNDLVNNAQVVEMIFSRDADIMIEMTDILIDPSSGMKQPKILKVIKDYHNKKEPPEEETAQEFVAELIKQQQLDYPQPSEQPDVDLNDIPQVNPEEPIPPATIFKGSKEFVESINKNIDSVEKAGEIHEEESEESGE